ncbi:hypothetical protein SAMN02799624_04520 [Paenibacillus sp. UNC496MF]|uniref:hypothetical protein n=1 Tax=Paenibacillus sp. UNC496MF TaxID=1502753 RepID=UPI0008F04FFC|nr:hypothetical protein [Paenibacillus sp. UNC496MF]SFJ43833.1 hypothetical protein SAMN02799624_04520 [Paenibacillus sp. UNC496MF]
MTREQLAAEARRAGKNAVHNLNWTRKYPDRYEPDKRAEMEAYLLMMIQFARYEIENARRPGRTSVRSRVRELMFSILSFCKHLSKGDMSIWISKRGRKNFCGCSATATV